MARVHPQPSVTRTSQDSYQNRMERKDASPRSPVPDIADLDTWRGIDWVFTWALRLELLYLHTHYMIIYAHIKQNIGNSMKFLEFWPLQVHQNTGLGCPQWWVHKLIWGADPWTDRTENSWEYSQPQFFFGGQNVQPWEPRTEFWSSLGEQTIWYLDVKVKIFAKSHDLEEFGGKSGK